MILLLGFDWSAREIWPLINATLWFAVIFAVLAIAFKLMRKFRDRKDRDDHDPSMLLTEFRELHSRGTLSDAEYRTIKAQLASQLREQLDKGETDAPPTFEEVSETDADKD